jgi:hypothetical protein
VSNAGRYKDGLEGKKPSEVFRESDEEGFRAQQAGYREHLSNQDLAKQIIEANQIAAGTYEGGGSSGPPILLPLTFGIRVLRGSIGVAFAIGALFFAGSVADYESTKPPGLPGDVYARLVADAVIFFLLAYCSYRILRHAVSRNSKSRY